MRRTQFGGGLSCAIVLVLLGACGSTPEEPETPSALEELKGFQPPEEPIESVLLRLRAAQESWYIYKLDLPRQEAAAKLDRSERYRRDTASRYLPEILQELQTGSEFHRTVAAFAAGWPRNPEAIQPLINALRDPLPVVVEQACAGLYVLALPEIPSEPLIEVAERHVDPNCRSNAVLALSSLAFLPGRQDLRAPLLGLLESQDARIRVHALRGLIPLVQPEDRSRLLPLLSDPVPLVRRAAVAAAGRINDPVVVEALIQAVSAREKDENVRLYARKALQRLSGGEDAGYDERSWRTLFAPLLEGAAAEKAPGEARS